MGRNPEGFSPFVPEETKSPETEQRPNQRQIDWLNEHVPVISFRHGGGAGGQNKNKVSSAADLRWLVDGPNSDTVFSQAEKNLINQYFPRSQKGSSGEIHLVASRSRDFGENRERVLNRLIDGVTEALNPDPNRIPTRPTRSSVVRRLETKEKRGRTKQARRQKDFE
jgi:ribosome-associated protein